MKPTLKFRTLLILASLCRRAGFPRWHASLAAAAARELLVRHEPWRDVPVTMEFVAELFRRLAGADGKALVIEEATKLTKR